MTLPAVLRSDGSTEPWNRARITDTLVRETRLSTELHNVHSICKELANDIALRVEGQVLSLKMNSPVTSHLVRELVVNMLRSQGMSVWADVCSRVGMSVYDACAIDTGAGYNAHDNANQVCPPEKSHKDKADYITKQQNLALFPPHIRQMHLDGTLHVHDLDYFRTRVFCSDYDLRWLFYYGLVPSGNTATSAVARPAQNAEVAILQAVKMMGAGQTHCAGGQGFYNFLTFLAPYLKGLHYRKIKQLMQMFVYELMQMYVSRGGQAVFSSVQLSPGIPKIWRDRNPVYKGAQWMSETYWDFEREVRLAFKALMEVMLEGDAEGKPFAFPKPEISIEPCFMEPDGKVNLFDKLNPDLPTYQDLYLDAAELAAKFGTPYFDNQMPEYRGAGDGISCYQCCAYQFSKNIGDDPEFEDKLNFKNGKHFSMGSNMVVSLNLPRIAYGSQDSIENAIDWTKTLMNYCIDIFKIKHQAVQKVINLGRLPFLSQNPRDICGDVLPGGQLVDFDGLVYTIGIVGLDDAVKAVTGYRMHESKVSLQVGLNWIMELQDHAAYLSEKNGIEIALARTPAETTAQRFAVLDLFNSSERISGQAEKCVQGDVHAAKRLYPETKDLPIYYTNGTHVPPAAPVSVAERIDLEQKFFPILDGGNIMHIWLGESWSANDGLWELIKHIATRTQAGYFAFTKDFTLCLNCGKVNQGIQHECPDCGSYELDWMSRITGYMSAVSGWNAGKRQELQDRQRLEGSDK